MKMKKRVPIRAILLTVTMLTASLSGCTQNNSPGIDTSAFLTDLTKLSVPSTVQIAGLGEASHGSSEFQQLKGDVFKALVANNDCQVFAIEGDFGGCARVNEYIHGGGGTAYDAVSAIGFRIYRTQEMVDIVEWMRDYNESAPIGEDLKFYGFDMQRYDNNRALLFEYLNKNMPELAQKYESKFVHLTDETMYSLDNATIIQAETDILALMQEMEAAIMLTSDDGTRFEDDMALEYARCMLENTQLRASGTKYSTLRDAFMAERVTWINGHEDGIIYINGHNGHIAKESISSYTCMGELLAEKYGDTYFAIGTDSEITHFNAHDGNEYNVFDVENSNFFTDQLAGLISDDNFYYLEFAQVSQNDSWQEILITPQRMTALNVDFSEFSKSLKTFYTVTVTPLDAYNGVIVLKQTTPTQLLD